MSEKQDPFGSGIQALSNEIDSDPWVMNKRAEERRKKYAKFDRGGPPRRLGSAVQGALEKALDTQMGPTPDPRDVPCKHCGQPVEISGFAQMVAEVVGDLIEQRHGGDRPGDDQIMMCPACAGIVQAREEAAAEVDREKVGIMFGKWATGLPPSETGKKWLRKMGHGLAVSHYEHKDRKNAEEK